MNKWQVTSGKWQGSLWCFVLLTLLALVGCGGWELGGDGVDGGV